MKTFATFAGALLLCACTTPFVSADEGDDEPPRHSVRVEVLLVSSDGSLDQEDRQRLSGKTSEVMSSLRKLVADEKAMIVNHAELTTLEEQSAMLQIGETVAVRSGAMRGPTGRSTNSYTNMSIGTLIKVMTKVVDDHVIVEFDFSKSDLDRVEGDDESDRPEGTSQLTYQSTLRVKNGEAQLSGRMMSSGFETYTSSQLIVAVEILGSREVGQTTRFQTFPRPSARSRAADRGSNGPSQDRGSTQLPPVEIRERIAESMFARADRNDDDMISEDELSGLNPRNDDAELPLARATYVDWFVEDYLPNRIRARTAGSARSRSRSFRPPSRATRSSDTEDDARDEEEDEDDDEDVEEEESRRSSEAQIEVVPELGTIILRGSKEDVKKVAEVIEKIGEKDDDDVDRDEDE